MQPSFSFQKPAAEVSTDDDRIIDQVRMRLAGDADVKGGALGSHRERWRSCIKGRVDTEKGKSKATKLAKKVKGVKSVDNQLRSAHRSKVVHTVSLALPSSRRLRRQRSDASFRIISAGGHRLIVDHCQIFRPRPCLSRLDWDQALVDALPKIRIGANDSRIRSRHPTMMQVAAPRPTTAGGRATGLDPPWPPARIADPPQSLLLRVLI